MEKLRNREEQVGSTLATNIASRLRHQIATGAIPPGEKLRLDDLRAAFGVSLSPLREALSRLSVEGFVVMEDQRGYRVAPVSEDNLVEVTRLRSEFECFALRESIARGDEQWESEIVASLYRLGKLHSSSEQLPEWEIAHRNFHQKLLSACRMPLLLQFCATLHDLNDRYRRLFLAGHPFDTKVPEEHARIVDATIARKADEASTLLRAHIERTGRIVLAAVTRQP